MYGWKMEDQFYILENAGPEKRRTKKRAGGNWRTTVAHKIKQNTRLPNAQNKWSFKIQSCIFRFCILRSCIFRNIGPANSGPAFSGPSFSALPSGLSPTPSFALPSPRRWIAVLWCDSRLKSAALREVSFQLKSSALNHEITGLWSNWHFWKHW